MSGGRAGGAAAAPPPDAGPGGADGVRVRIDLAYRGDRFHGWQEQPGLRTVQGELTRLTVRLLGRPVQPLGAGRTDAGVHARRQVCHLTVRDGAEADRLRRLEGLAPSDLQILAVTVAAPSFHARFGAVARRYSYHLLLRRDVFRQATAWLVPAGLDREAMDAAAAHFPGTQDFSSFCKRSSLKKGGNVCRVERCGFQWVDDSAILHVRANRFLHHMVRNLVGTLVEVGRGRRRPDDIPLILAARDRTRAGRCAPAHGLFLEEVIYPAEHPDPLSGPRRPAPRARPGAPPAGIPSRATGDRT